MKQVMPFVVVLSISGMLSTSCRDSSSDQQDIGLTLPPAIQTARGSVNVGPTVDSAEELEAVWMAHAVVAGLTEQEASRVGVLLRAAYPADGEGYSVPAEPLGLAVERYVEQFHPVFRDKRRSEGKVYWTTYALCQARRRGPMEAQASAKLKQQCDELADMTVRLLRARLKDHLGDEQYRKYGQQITTGVNWVGRRIAGHGKALAEDPLYPAMKSPISSDVLAKVKDMLEADSMPRIPTESDGTRSVEERVVKKLQSHFQDIPERVLCEVTYRSTIDELNKNSYWGHMKYRLWSTEGWWPIDVTFVPNGVRNGQAK